MMHKNKRGVLSLNDVPSAVMILVSIGIFLGVGALIISEIQANDAINADQTNSSAAFNATSNTLAGLDDLSSFIPIIAIVIAAAVILGVVFLIRT